MDCRSSVVIQEVLKTRKHEHSNRQILTCKVLETAPGYFEKWDTVRTVGSTSSFTICDIGKDNTYDLALNRGELLINVPYVYSSNYDLTPPDLQDEISLLPEKERVEIMHSILKFQGALMRGLTFN